MTLDDACKILGLAPDEDPRPHLAEFQNARDHIAAMVRSAPNEVLADRYQKGLSEFDRALAVVQGIEPAEVPEITSKPKPVEPVVVIPPPAKTRVIGVVPPRSEPSAAVAVVEPPAAEMEPEKRKGRALSYFAWFVILFLGATGGGWLYVQTEQTKRDQRRIRVAFLERQSSVYLENRRWQDAAANFDEMEKLSPGSEIVRRGRRSIEAGMAEEQTQFVGYWTGQALAELEAGRLDEAVAAAKQVLDKFPGEKEASSIMARITAARSNQSRIAALATARDALSRKDWNAAVTSARNILATSPDDPDAKAILADGTAGMAKAAADLERANDLLQKAIAKDQGQFDQEILDWLREAAALAPGNTEIAARLEKFASYARTLHVPGDFATPAEALANAHDRDRIVLAAGAWKGPLVINAAVELQGAGSATVKVECPPENGSAITIGPRAKGARVSGITFRHESFAVGSDRYSVALVRGGIVTFADCHFMEASGHGLAVIEGGQATVTRSRFADNGWDGIAAFGHGVTLEVNDSEALNNFEHGIESWDGAAVILSNNRCEGNSRNGIHADNGLASATIENNQLVANREFGLVLDSASSGNISGNVARSNLLGGFVIRLAAKSLKVTGNQATLNQGSGLILERGLDASAFASNTVSKNTGQQILSGANLNPPAETPVDTTQAPKATIVIDPDPVSEEPH